MRIGIAGITGRIGRLLADLAVDRGHTLAGGTGRPGGTRQDLFEDVADLAAACDVLIDFSHPSAVLAHASALTGAGVPWVLGTTGLDEAAQSAVLAASRRIALVQAANFSTGMTLVATLAGRLAAALPEADYDAEIIETHHRGKRDAPSGTALALGHAVARGRGREFADLAVLAREGETGPRAAGAIGFAVQRGGTIVGEHALSFIGASERITLSHDVFDRRVFAEGALRAASWLLGKPPGHYTMADVLGLGPKP